MRHISVERCNVNKKNEENIPRAIVYYGKHQNYKIKKYILRSGGSQKTTQRFDLYALVVFIVMLDFVSVMLYNMVASQIFATIFAMCKDICDVRCPFRATIVVALPWK